MTNSKKPFLYHVEFMRAAAIILVVFSHVPDWGNDANRQLFNSIFLNATVLFLFISGYLFTYLNKVLDYRVYMGKKLTHVFLPYLVVSAVIVLFRIFIARNLSVSGPADLAYDLLNGTAISGPFWYIPVVMLFFIAAPLLHWLCCTPKVARIAVPLLLLVSCLTFRSEPMSPTIGNAVVTNLILFVHFCGIYCIGGMVGANQEKFDAIIRQWWFLAAMVVIYALSFALYRGDYGAQVSTSFQDVVAGRMVKVNFAQVRMLALTFFLYGLGINRVKKRYPAVKLVAETSFGIYFTHYSILKYLYPFLVVRVGDSLALMIFSGIVALAGSTAFVWLVRRLLGKKSMYVIGS